MFYYLANNSSKSSKSACLITLIGRAKEIRSQLDNISGRARCYMDEESVEERKRRRKEKEKENEERTDLYLKLD